ncbi:Glycosyltransferase involved in cell wall bisynthesis [Lentzea fradiae]|uniref:Glycosyltransferase involved in cell wall bisynthesis n=1 Tax=Lentzea fradiae TaxID=200378 RepID=A0A1G7KQ23_9PSEU|nr:glycosyltransferase [Lentzea fradiae]SDF38849.1 Glycosyltransferase involved in cell wall bisynthesis [Lentzea fradiae]
MRIAIVSVQACPLADGTGQSSHVAELCAGLSAAGHEVVVHTRRDAPEPTAGKAGYTVEHVRAGPPRVLTEDELVPHLGDFAEHLATRWRQRPPDVVHAHHWTSGLVSVIAAHLPEVPVVHSCHGLRESTVELCPDAESLVVRRAALLTATSTAEAAELWRLGVPRGRVSVVPSGVDATLFHPEGPVDLHDGRVRIALAGPPSEDATAATDTLLSTVDNIELVAVHEVPRQDRPKVLRSADVVLCAPTSERYGIVALEAMACGVPVVATAVGALADIVLPDVTGVLVRPGDSRHLARTLRALLTDETLRERYGIAARDRVLGRYSRGRLAREAVAVYERVARRLPAGR